MEFILVVFISGGMVENCQNGVSRSLTLFMQLRAVQWINVLKKVARKQFIFGPSSINHFPYKINFSLDLSLKNWAH